MKKRVEVFEFLLEFRQGDRRWQADLDSEHQAPRVSPLDAWVSFWPSREDASGLSCPAGGTR
jgi:hypothetical protein